MQSLLFDLRYAFRGLRKSPGFAAVAVLTLAIGIAAATAGFSLVNWVLLRPLPGVRGAEGLGLVWIAQRLPGGGMQPNGLLPPDVAQLSRLTPALTALIGYQGGDVNLALPGAPPRRMNATFAMPGYFQALGTRMKMGRALGPADYSGRTGADVMVISDHIWRSLLGSTPDIIGRRLAINGIPFSVVGVAERGFRDINRLDPVDLWLPSPTLGVVAHFKAEYQGPSDLYQYVARLSPRADWAIAERQLQAAMRGIVVAAPDRFNNRTTATVFAGLGLQALGRDSIGFSLRVTMIVAGLVLLGACANAGNLLLFRRLQRRADGVIRLALGASRARLFRHHLAESVLLGLLGAMGSLPLLPMALRGLEGLRVGWSPLGHVSLDWRVFAFAAGTGLVAAFLAGTIPAWLGSRLDLTAELKENGPAQSSRAPRLRTALVVVQIAVALTMASGGYLFARTLENLAHVPLGLDPDQVSVFYVRPKAMGYSPERTRAYLASLAAGVRAAPGVRQVALAELTPFLGISHSAQLHRAGGSADDEIEVNVNHVSPDYFSTLHIGRVRGRTFNGAEIVPDSQAPRVILSRSLATRLFGAGDPVGQLVAFGSSRPSTATVVGVVEDSRWLGPQEEAEPMLYAPLGQGEGGAAWLEEAMLLAKGPDAGTVARAVQRAARVLDPGLPIEPRGTLREAVSATVASRTFFFRVVGTLAIITLVLTGVGVYSLAAFGVASRRREFGIRIALGADAGDLLSAVIRPAAWMVLAGVLAGTAGALLINRHIRSLLFRVSPFDVTAFLGAAALLTIIVFLASYLPARRASRVDPMTVLREE